MRRKTDAEKLDALNRQYKQKNQYIAANYDRIGIVTPKGTRDYIKSLGMSANSYINGLIEADRRRREAAEAADTDLQESRQEGPDAKPQEAPQGAASGARTNRHEATKSPTEGRTEAQEKPRKARRTGPAARQKIGNEGPDARKDLHPIKAGDAATAPAEAPDEDAPGWLPFS